MKPMMIATIAGEAGSAAAFWTYIAYLLISVALTIWVARTLHKNGRIFLVDSLLGNEPLADSVNHLLVVGFYLINIGFVTLALKYGRAPVRAAPDEDVPAPVGVAAHEVRGERVEGHVARLAIVARHGRVAGRAVGALAVGTHRNGNGLGAEDSCRRSAWSDQE